MKQSQLPVFCYRDLIAPEIRCRRPRKVSMSIGIPTGLISQAMSNRMHPFFIAPVSNTRQPNKAIILLHNRKTNKVQYSTPEQIRVSRLITRDTGNNIRRRYFIQNKLLSVLDITNLLKESLPVEHVTEAKIT